MNLTEIGFKGVELIHLTQDGGSLVDSCEHGNEHSISIKG